jgi:hypothetical protein
MITAIAISTVAWFVSAAILFFNPIVGKIYSSQENDPAVKSLPQVPATMGKILLAVLVQCALWALIYSWVKNSLPIDFWGKVLIFGSIISFMKMIPRDIDRLLLTTYPVKRMTIEFIIGVVCAYIVAAVFAWFI